ncbi:MAG: NYN domain-containing protein [Thermostichales cyanobacterium SZTDM-1c_bins_54]
MTLLIVDGYNVIGAWPDLQRLQRETSLELARDRLVESLSSYVAVRGYQAIVVFDAYAQTTPTQHLPTSAGIQVCFTAWGETADSWIERCCAENRGSRRRIRVATSDRMQQLVVSGYGAEWMSAQQLWREVQQTAKEIRSHQQHSPGQGQSLARFLDANTRARLNQWRIQGSDPG